MSANQTQQPYAGLSNKQIVVIYYRFKRYKSSLDENLSKNRLMKMVEHEEMGKVPAMHIIPDSHVEKFKSSAFYQEVESIIRDLEPVVQIIEECDSSIQDLLHELR